YLSERFGMGLADAGLTATLSPQLASLAGACLGGWLADRLRRRVTAGRALVQLAGVLGAAPFVLLCGRTDSLPLLVLALGAWGLFKGLYDANIFAALFDVVPAEARGGMAGLMKLVGWLGGGAPGPLPVGALAPRAGL